MNLAHPGCSNWQKSRIIDGGKSDEAENFGQKDQWRVEFCHGRMCYNSSQKKKGTRRGYQRSDLMRRKHLLSFKLVF